MDAEMMLRLPVWARPTSANAPSLCDEYLRCVHIDQPQEIHQFVSRLPASWCELCESCEPAWWEGCGRVQGCDLGDVITTNADYYLLLLITTNYRLTTTDYYSLLPVTTNYNECGN